MTKVIIDVREPFEYAFGHVKGALNIPASSIRVGEMKLAEIPLDADIVVYCLSGHRAAASAEALKKIGYRNVENGIHRKHVEKMYPSH